MCIKSFFRCILALQFTIIYFLFLVRADNCAMGSSKVMGNWYCQPVGLIHYSGVGQSGTYNEIVSMEPDGKCSAVPHHYSGPIAPFDEELSVHFRGPLNLLQFAVYAPEQPVTHMNMHRSPRPLRFQRHRRAECSNANNNMITATIDGKVVSWRNPDAAKTTCAPASEPTQSIDRSLHLAKTQTASKSQSNSSSPVPQFFSTIVRPSQIDESLLPTGFVDNSLGTIASGSGPESQELHQQQQQSIGSRSKWNRVAYFNLPSQTAEGLVFLNNKGGQSSGVFDYKFGNSLSYASSDTRSGAASPQILSSQLDSNVEVILMSDQKCVKGDSCGYTREGTVAYHGWGGADKVFVAEFIMPDDGTSGWNMNMPSFWLLNAKIPRTVQYGSPECSCWKTGCGEFDVCEVLDSGNNRCKSTLHGNKSGGNSDYFSRPVSRSTRMAVVFAKGEIAVRVLNNDFSFESLLSQGPDTLAALTFGRSSDFHQYTASK